MFSNNLTSCNLKDNVGVCISVCIPIWLYTFACALSWRTVRSDVHPNFSASFFFLPHTSVCVHTLRVQNVPNLRVKRAQGEKDRLMIGLPQTRSTKALSGCIVWPTIVVRKKKLMQYGIATLGIMKHTSTQKQMEQASKLIRLSSGDASPFRGHF